MDWEQLRERTLGEVGTSLISEGGGVTAGFLGAAIVGRQIQNRIKADGAIVSGTDKIVAWSANNVPKIAMWYLLKRYTAVEPGETLTPMKEATVDAKKAVAGSIVFDTLVRLSKGGKNPASVDVFGYQLLTGAPDKAAASSQSDIQRLIQENSALRAELNKALQRLATPAPQAPPVVQVQAPPVVQVQAPAQPIVQAQPPQAPPVIRYQPVTPPIVSYTPAPQPAPIQRAAPVAPIVHVEQRPPVVRAEELQIPPYSKIPYSPGQPFAPYASQPPAVQERERKYGFMESSQPPVVQERQKRYGFMSGEEKDIAAMFGML